MGDTLREQVAGRLRAWLSFHRMSTAELARKLGWSQSYTTRRIDGRITMDLDDLEQISKALGISPADLMTTEKEGEQGTWVRVAYPVAAGQAPKPNLRGGFGTGRSGPPTFGQRSGTRGQIPDSRKIHTRPPGHPTTPLRRAA